MALALERTLSALRGELKTIVLGSGQAGVTGDDDVYWNTILRKAQAIIYEKANWLTKRTFVSIPIAAGSSQCDWPDGVEPGKIVRVSAKVASGLEWPLDQGIDPEDRSAWNLAAFGKSAYFPCKWDVQNGVLLYGPPASNSVTLNFEYIAKGVGLYSEDDRASCDSDCLLMQAEILAKIRFAPDEVAGLQAIFADFLVDKEHNQSMKSTTTIAGETFDPAVRRSRRMHGIPWYYAGRRPLPFGSY